MAGISASLVFGVVGNILSILVFLSPMKTFRRVWKQKSTENFKALPYVCTLLSTSLWSYYGIIKPGATLILTINAAGTVLQSFYVVNFLIFAPRQPKLKTAVMSFVLNGLGFGAVFVGTFFGTKGSERISIVGAICSAISVSMYASPLTVMRTVVRTKSVEFMPFFLSLFLFLNGGVWAVYALLVKDIYVEIPNTIGFVLGAVQLLLWVYYKNFGATPKKTKADGNSIEEEGMLSDDNLEMGRSVSLPKQLNSHEDEEQGPTAAVQSYRSLPAKILKTSSAKVADLLNSLQQNESNYSRSRHLNGSATPP